MSTSPEQDPDPLNSASRDLARIREDVAAARRELADVHRQLAEGRRLVAQQQVARLVEANEHLVLATMAAQRASEASEQAMREMTEAARRDPLTGLPTSEVLRSRLSLAIQAAGTSERKPALLLLNLADFRLINDTLGRTTGDQVLALAARALVDAAGATATVSRHSSNEFLILLHDVETRAQAVARAADLVAALGAPRMVEDHVLRLAANVGISLHPRDGSDADSLIEAAVAAMYHVKWGRLPGYPVESEGEDGTCTALRPLESMRQPLTRFGLAERASDTQHALLQAANTQLVLAAISAQELQAAAEEAQQRQARFLAVLAHELRNPLTPISAAATLLGRVRPETPTLSKLQAIIERQVKTINRLVEDLIDMSRVNAGKLKLELELVDICILINDVVEACRPKLDARLHALSIVVPQAQVQVMGDPVRLTQVLTNLLDNASKYTPPSGRIGIAVTLLRDEVVITVTDNGIGIGEEALSTIFEPFVQEQHATVFNGVGLGIGLTVVRELVQAHGGRVEVSSPGRDRGSVFVLTFPLAAAKAPGN